MERAGIMRDLSQIEAQIGRLRVKPRQGQLRALEGISEHESKLNVKLPTGYGKTYLAMASYSILKSLGEVNRLLVIFPSDSQLVQFEQSIPNKWCDYAIDGPNGVSDIRFYGAEAIKHHAMHSRQVFAITVQSLIGARGMDNVQKLLEKGRWMIVVDEYHHYGIDKPFGQAVLSLNYNFLLCMSATPSRPDDDSAFGKPHISVSYREAEEEGAVKSLRGHSYHYKIDAINGENEVVSFTTEQLKAEAGGDKPGNIKKLLIDKKLRWSPKYISPLITNPIERMLCERLRTGHKLQAIVGAMCVSHAELVCDQITSTFPELKADWVGTGDDGRTPDENAAILKSFAPTDEAEPDLDVLVHVGMAGEGLDTVRVSEVIHLNAASVNNTNNQENGRAARFLPDVQGHINFDACSGFALFGYVGKSIMDAMDNEPPRGDSDDDEEPRKRNLDDWLELPEQPVIRIVDVECTSIDSGDETVKKMAGWLFGNVSGFDKSDLSDVESELWQRAIEGVRMMRAQEAAALNDKSVVKQWKDAVDTALSVVTGIAVKLMKANGVRADKSMIGDVKRRINGRKKRDLGAVSNDVSVYQQHYNWIKRLEVSMKDQQGVPEWLM